MAYQAPGMPALWCRFTLQSCLCPTPDLRSFHMGIALFNLSTLSSPLGTLARWLQPGRCLSVGSDAGTPRNSPRSDNPTPALGGRTEPVRPHHGPSGREDVRPLRGNWPFTVNPSAPSADTNARFNGGRSSCSPIRERLGQRSNAWKDARPDCTSTRVLQRATDLHTGAGRVVIAGRMADVCAELDRMAACEAALQAY